MIYCFDIDDTITKVNIGNKYEEAIPHQGVIDRINELYHEGNRIIFFTGRGGTSGIDWTNLTKDQLKRWGVNYHELIMNQKPHFDLLIDDKCINVEEWKKKEVPRKVGFLAGAFDLIHPGYVKIWEDAKTVCTYLIVGLHTDPTTDRPHKNKPVHSVEERLILLSSIKYIDEIVTYDTERDLHNLLKTIDPDVRILGSDYAHTDYNGSDLNIPVYFHDRNHDWSATNLRDKIK